MSFIEGAVDDGLIFDDGAASPYTASGVAQKDAADGVIDFGPNWKDNPHISVHLDVDDPDIADADETYTMTVEHGADSGFASITSTDERDIDASSEDYVEGRLQFAVTLRNRYLRVSYTLGGTTPSLPVNLGWISFLKQP